MNAGRLEARKCILCQRVVPLNQCPVGIEACPNRCELPLTGADIESKSVSAKVITSPTGEQAAVVCTEHGPITIAREIRGRASPKLNCFSPSTSLKECSPWKEHDTIWMDEL